MKDNKKEMKKPFFAQFMEAQLTTDPEEIQGGQGQNSGNSATGPIKDGITKPGSDHVTMKYPSDNDDWVLM